MSEIDGMDMLGFLRVRAWNARKEKEKKQEDNLKVELRTGGRYRRVRGWIWFCGRGRGWYNG